MISTSASSPPRTSLTGTALPTLSPAKQHEQVVRVLDGLAVQSREDVAYDEATTPRGTAVLYANDQQSAPLREAKPLSIGEAHRLAQDAEVSALDGAPLRERPAVRQARSAGMAKAAPRPQPETMMPSTFPSASMSGPPEKPGYGVASVWM